MWSALCCLGWWSSVAAVVMVAPRSHHDAAPGGVTVSRRGVLRKTMAGGGAALLGGGAWLAGSSRVAARDPGSTDVKAALAQLSDASAQVSLWSTVHGQGSGPCIVA